MRRFGNFMVGILMGAMVGSIAALLFAPMSGEELRTQAAERADAVRQDVLEG